MIKDLGGPVDQHETTASPERKALGRRTILKGAAWSVPAVLAVGATPAFAASNLKVEVTGIVASRDKKNVTFTLTVKNENTIPVTISSVQYPTPPGKWESFATATISATPWAAGSTANTVQFTGTERDNSDAFTTFTITLVDSRVGSSRTVTISGSSASPSYVNNP